MKFNTILYACLFKSGGKFSNIENFVTFTMSFSNNPNIDSKKSFTNELFTTINNIKLKYSNREIGDNEAKLILVCRDLEILYSKINYIWEDFSIDMTMYLNISMDILKSIGLNVTPPHLELVDKFPKPFAHIEGAALCPDKFDELKYNIKSGIYFRKDKLIPIKSHLTLGHEIIHSIIGNKNPELLARGLEEGICEFLGVLYCGAKIFNQEVVLNYFKYRRLKFSGHSQKFKLYIDYFRMASFIYANYGLEGIVHLVKGGRKLIKEVEIKLSNNEINSLSLPGSPTSIIDEIYRMSSYVSMLFSENETVSPMSYLISKNLQGDNNIDSVIKKLNLNKEQAKKSLREIETRIFGLLIDNESIEYSDLHNILKLHTYRYEI
ncbi:MAG: hypothetical protein ACEPOV_03170 [Hyphomicrobiales bacterium]